MECREFRDLMFERLSDELGAEQEHACLMHEQSCPACRAELRHYGELTRTLRAGWPSEDAPPLTLSLPQARPSRAWFDVAGLWISRAAAAAVAACLLLILLTRPAIRFDHGTLQMAFSDAATIAQPAAPALNETQVRAMVDSAVADHLARVAQPAVSRPAVNESAALQVRNIERSQAALWQQVNQHSLYFESLWRASQGVRQASFNPDRP